MKADLVIVGSGLAGATAALSAIENGAKNVTVIRKGYGRTAMSGGLLAFAADQNKAAGVSTLKDRLSAICENELNPYGLLSDSNKSLSDGCKLLVEKLPSFKADIKSDSKPGLFLSEGGAAVFADMQFGGGSGDLLKLDTKSVAVVSFKELSWFKLDQLVEQWREELTRLGVEVDLSLLELNLSDGLPLQMNSQAALLLDDKKNIEKLVEELKKLVADKKPGLLLFPPVMGLNNADVLAELEKALGIACAELSGGYNALAGLRLQRELDKALNDAGVKMLQAEVVGFAQVGQAIKSLKFIADGKENEIEAEAFIHAGGRFLGGGLIEDGGVRESVFKLPAYFANKLVSDLPTIKLVERDYAAEHILFSCGLTANENLNPLDENGKSFADNLYVCGDILGGYDLVLSGCAEGLAIATAHKAGQLVTGGSK